MLAANSVSNAALAARSAGMICIEAQNVSTASHAIPLR
jgi:hypothetical protein